jgi:hypothetical protein
MDPRRQASSGATSYVVVAAVLIVVTVVAIAVLESGQAASESTTSGVSTTSTPSTAVVASSETSSNLCANRSSTTSSSSAAEQGGVATPVAVGVYFDGALFQGPMMGFAVEPGSSSAISVTVTYPWAGFSSLPSDTCIPVSFAIGPFPANSIGSAIPSWLHVSPASASAAMTYGSNATLELRVSADDSAPAGAIGNFALRVTYLDPASGESTTDVNVLNLLAAPSASPVTRLTQPCCSTNVTSVTLAAPASPGSPANVTLTISNGGYYPAGYLEAFVENGTFPPENNPPPSSGIVFYNRTIPANGTQTFSFSVPSSSVAVVTGGQYTVLVEVYYVGSAGGGVFQFTTHRATVVAVGG